MNAIRHPRLHVKGRQLPESVCRQGRQGVRTARHALDHPEDVDDVDDTGYRDDTEHFEQLTLDIARPRRGRP